MFKLLSREDESRVQEIDKDIKNKFKWKWLEKQVTISVKFHRTTQNVTETLAAFVKKVDIPGKALCIYCNDLINYGSRGCIALTEHASKVKKHVANVAIRKSNYSLGSAFCQTSAMSGTKNRTLSNHSAANHDVDISHWGTLARPAAPNEPEIIPFTPVDDRQVHSEVRCR